MTKFFKYFQYVYLLFAAFFLVRGFYEFEEKPNTAYILWVMAGLVLCLYFFRKRYINKFNDHNKKDDPK